MAQEGFGKKGFLLPTSEKEILAIIFPKKLRFKTLYRSGFQAMGANFNSFLVK